jgi:hypothetical protein
MIRFLIAAGGLCVLLQDQANPSGPVAAQPRPGDKHAAHFLKCAEECNNCQRACDSCATHCGQLLAQGKKEHFATLQTCQDCSTFCSAAAAIAARQGPFADLICKACADACVRCAKECDKHAEHDAQMKQCAEACRKCEQACRAMLTHVSAARTAERQN